MAAMRDRQVVDVSKGRTNFVISSAVVECFESVSIYFDRKDGSLRIVIRDAVDAKSRIIEDMK